MLTTTGKTTKERGEKNKAAGSHFTSTGSAFSQGPGSQMKMPQRRARRWQQPIAKNCKSEGEFIKDCVMKMVVCPEKKQEEFADVSMA